jgi:hypothetical protein
MIKISKTGANELEGKGFTELRDTCLHVHEYLGIVIALDCRANVIVEAEYFGYLYRITGSNKK